MLLNRTIRDRRAGKLIAGIGVLHAPTPERLGAISWTVKLVYTLGCMLCLVSTFLALRNQVPHPDALFTPRGHSNSTCI